MSSVTEGPLLDARMVQDVSELLDVYLPLVTDLNASVVSMQVASVNPIETIGRIGTDVLPQLRAYGGRRARAHVEAYDPQ